MKRKMFTDRRGNLGDIVYISAILFGLAIALIVIYFAWSQLKSPMSSSLEEVGDPTTFNVSDFYEGTSGGLTTFDTMLPFIFIGYLIFTIVSAFMIKSHPMLFFISLFGLAIFIIIAVIFGNVYKTISETSEFTSSASNYDMVTLFMKNLPTIIMVTFFVVILVLFMKPKKSYISGGI